MIKRLVGWFVLVPLCVILVLFALSNRHVVQVRFDPLDSQNALLPGISVPLFVVIYAMLIVGIICGGMAAWWAQGRHRREERRLRREADRLGKQVEQLKKSGQRQVADPLLLEDEDLLDKV